MIDDEIIYKDLDAAIAACVKYEDEIFRLQCKLGVTVKRLFWDEDLTSSEYYDEGGKQKTYYH